MSTTWINYPVDGTGCYAQLGSILMTAHPSGAWSAWEQPGFGSGRVLSGMAEDKTLEGAKHAAQNAGTELFNQPSEE